MERWWISGGCRRCVCPWTAIEASVLCACLILSVPPPSTQLFLSEPGLFQEPGMWLMRLILSGDAYTYRYVPRRLQKASCNRASSQVRGERVSVWLKQR
ncbi:hypothetical protein CGRA01v4_08250 [Colletotrichum graminicola]|nr:hypothetical protein CGRA01v4_08250 [Colletotrichum graminicola]